ncbi:MAG: RluA family pseudouridine synthase [Desulfobulbaceae bacterium]|nr:MAG: RluA family pseudouridine synthase [Desulfobulbaceae bacterium]
MRFQIRADVSASIPLIDLLHGECSVSKTKLKKAINAGAVWLIQGKRRKRLRRATRLIESGSQIALYYDEEIINFIPPQPTQIHTEQNFSVWYKPPFLLSQGTLYGDHCSILRIVEQTSGKQIKPFLIHRIDREASGLILIGHSKSAARKLTELFTTRKITKKYLAELHGRAAIPSEGFTIDIPLDNKSATTLLEYAHYNSVSDSTVVQISITTGRKHQIRRHLQHIGYEIIGDKRYGSKTTKNLQELKLKAFQLAFNNPFDQKAIEIILPNDLMQF